MLAPKARPSFFRAAMTAAAIASLGTLPLQLLSNQSVMIRADLHFGEAAQGLLVSVAFGIGALVSVAITRFGEVHGRRPLTLLAAACTLACALGIALLAHHYLVLLLFVLIGGVGQAGLTTAANFSLSETVAPGRQGLGFGVKQSAPPAAALIAGLAVPAVGLWLGWRWTYGLLALSAVTLLLAATRIPRKAAPSAPGVRNSAAPTAATTDVPRSAAPIPQTAAVATAATTDVPRSAAPIPQTAAVATAATTDVPRSAASTHQTAGDPTAPATNVPSSATLTHKTAATTTAPTTDVPSSPPSPHPAQPPAPLESAPRSALFLTACAMLTANGSAMALIAFLPQWAHLSGLSASTAGFFVAACSALAITGRLLVGAAADRRNGRNLPVVTLQMAAGSIGLALLALGNVPLVLIGGLVAFALGWSWPGLLIFAVVRLGRDRPNSAAAFVQAGAFAGGAFGPLLFGLVAGSAGYPAAWLVMAVGMAVGAALLTLARRQFVADLKIRPVARTA
ncbi:MFS transporter [Kineosporia rhizophila]|uniref:MFS transporter n=1 Tax=Kineosporia rhizophila TaxID=84633 RepID=UPI001E350710|nr:MFS transporter [Kineosporia rhizophila]